eukprot:1634809-Rhodomonas_salina.1
MMNRWPGVGSRVKTAKVSGRACGQEFEEMSPSDSAAETLYQLRQVKPKHKSAGFRVQIEERKNLEA